MTVTLLGYKRMEGVGKKSGKPYNAYVLYVQYEDARVDGYACTDVFVNIDVLGNTQLGLGANYELGYNQYGNLISIELTN